MGPNSGVGPNLDPKNGSKKVNLGPFVASVKASKAVFGSIWEPSKPGKGSKWLNGFWEQWVLMAQIQKKLNFGLGTVGAFGTKVEIWLPSKLGSEKCHFFGEN